MELTIAVYKSLCTAMKQGTAALLVATKAAETIAVTATEAGCKTAEDWDSLRKWYYDTYKETEKVTKVPSNIRNMFFEAKKYLTFEVPKDEEKSKAGTKSAKSKKGNGGTKKETEVLKGIKTVESFDDHIKNEVSVWAKEHGHKRCDVAEGAIRALTPFAKDKTM